MRSICAHPRLLQRLTFAKDSKNRGEDEVGQNDWWDDFITMEQIKSIRVSGKWLFGISIINQCGMCGDKLVIFSQSKRTLKMIEEMLQIATQLPTPLLTGSWKANRDYYLFNGSSTQNHRNEVCSIFGANSVNSTAKYAQKHSKQLLRLYF